MKKAIAGFIYFILLVVFLVIMFAFGGCTDNTRVRKYGGTAELTLQQGQKLVNLTWKDNNLWVLTKPMTETDKEETYTFQEESRFGVLEGSYIIHEVK